ncbi:MAG TPA: hypothetical protein VHX88_02655 [Solirubrobacteraceae bacterium]|jgi:hypothetical protein|nr:hypothetical protein [Solirubrobacteraceae bacterium]
MTVTSGPSSEIAAVERLLAEGHRFGAISAQAYVGELPALVAEIDAGTIEVTADAVPFSEVECPSAQSDRPGARTVLVPLATATSQASPSAAYSRR